MAEFKRNALSTQTFLAWRERRKGGGRKAKQNLVFNSVQPPHLHHVQIKNGKVVDCFETGSGERVCVRGEGGRRGRMPRRAIVKQHSIQQSQQTNQLRVLENSGEGSWVISLFTEHILHSETQGVSRNEDALNTASPHRLPVVESCTSCYQQVD